MKKLVSLLMLLVLFAVGSLPAAAQGDKDIVAIAAGDDRFETLVTAVEAAGLVETLQGEGPFTVFAPTDDAFAALPAGTLDALLADKEALTAVLTYHVVAGEVLAADVVGMDGEMAKTVQGESVTITVEGSTVMVNDATVVITDIQASNGVIHVIDKVLVPPTIAAEMAAGSGGATTTTTAAPTTMPATGADASLPLLPIAAILAGTVLLGGAYALRPRA